MDITAFMIIKKNEDTKWGSHRKFIRILRYYSGTKCPWTQSEVSVLLIDWYG
jgi:hypothetical protein